MTVQIQSGSIANYVGALGPSPLYVDMSVTAVEGQGSRALFLIFSTNFAWDNESPPTCDGVAMTLVSRETDATRKSVMYMALAPSVGVHTVRIGAVSWVGVYAAASAFVLDGVDQTTPFGTAVKDAFWGNAAPRSLSITCPAGGMVIAGHAIYGATAGSITLGTGQTALIGSSSLDTTEYRHSYKVDATAMEFSWTGGANQGSQLLVAVTPAAGGNPAPTFPGPSIGNQTGTEGIALSSNTVSDSFSDSDALTFSKIGTWPDGVNLSSSGIISGTPTTAGTYASLKVRATDTADQSIDSDTFSFTISAAVGTGTITTPALKNNTGTILASLSDWTVNVYHVTTGALIVQKTGLTTSAGGVLTITDAAIVAGTTYAYEPVHTTYGRRSPTDVAS